MIVFWQTDAVLKEPRHHCTRTAVSVLLAGVLQELKHVSTVTHGKSKKTEGKKESPKVTSLSDFEFARNDKPFSPSAELKVCQVEAAFLWSPDAGWDPVLLEFYPVLLDDPAACHVCCVLLTPSLSAEICGPWVGDKSLIGLAICSQIVCSLRFSDELDCLPSDQYSSCPGTVP